MRDAPRRALIRITGVVQGVGFRPFVHNLAVRHGLRGYCLNDSSGVVIDAEGEGLAAFMDELKSSPPPLARIETFTVEHWGDGALPPCFEIRESVPVEGGFAHISPDMAVCPECLTELFDPKDRRHLYPFINCTNCGPRYSIVTDVPYDRAKTTMDKFAMCPECASEYKDPSDRRFHAQPNACASCGPAVWITTDEPGRPSSKERLNGAAICETRRLLKDGAIFAIKGIGGFHLVCDAANDAAVKRLRETKRISASRLDLTGGMKPFALMAPSIEAAAAFAVLTEADGAALADRSAPMVLCAKKPLNSISARVAPENGRFGVMLPCAPLHHLLFRPGPPEFQALVATSGNRSEEPIVTANEEAVRRLGGMADYFLLHDRDIYMRVDDSIISSSAKGTRILRRARGYAPDPVSIKGPCKNVLACGAELKNTFTVTKGGHAIISQHIGDLKNMESLAFFRESLDNIKKTFRAEPSVVAHDMHPDYLSTRFAHEYAKEFSIPPSRVIAVQHHHAHIASVMAEHGLRRPVIGIALDGTGWGPDSTIWGGEFLLCEGAAFKRAAHLMRFRLPGGDAAIKEPWRCAVSLLMASLGNVAYNAIDELYTKRVGRERLGAVMRMVERGINSPFTSSAGRLFDAVSSILSITDVITFEAEAAIRLEHSSDMDAALRFGPYPFALSEGEPFIVDTAPLVRAMVDDVLRGLERGAVAGRFHLTLALAAGAAALRIREKTGVNDSALSGGVFQNSIFAGLARTRLEEAGFAVWMNEKVPANDGGISLGQAAVAAAAINGPKD